MIPIEALNVKRILVHANCPDGVASALILHDALPYAEVVFCQYGSAALAALEARDGDLFCDFSPPADRVGEWLAVKGTIVLDHHATARGVVEQFGELGVYANADDEPGVSGAVLAYLEVWATLKMGGTDRLHFMNGESFSWPVRAEIVRMYCRSEVALICAFAAIAGVRDTWQTSNVLWSESCAQAEALRFWSADHLLSLRPDRWADAMSIGPVLVRKNRERDKRLYKQSYKFGKVLCVEGITVEDLAEMTRQSKVCPVCVGTPDPDDTDSFCHSCGRGCHVVAGFHYFVDSGVRRLRVSMRSYVEDVSAIAKRYGGGGHGAAAGFTIDAPTGQNPYEFVEKVVTRGIQAQCAHKWVSDGGFEIELLTCTLCGAVSTGH